MRFLRHEQERLLFELRADDRKVLGRILRLYPVIPAGHAEVTHSTVLDPDGERQQLLEVALAEQRGENQDRIDAFLNAGQRFEPRESHFILRLTESETDWLLEVLNEVRVGSWIRLGRPQQGFEGNLSIPTDSLRYLWAMEMSGYLEMRLLDGLAAQP